MIARMIPLVLVALALCRVSLAEEDRPPAYNGLLSIIAADAIVAVGEKAHTTEREAAELIAQALRDAGGPKDNLRKAEDVDKPEAVDEIGRRHVIAVGTVASNPVLQHYPGTWFIDREQYYIGKASAGYAPPTGEPRDTVRGWQPFTGFYVGGFGTYRDDRSQVGYVECDRSEYYMWARSKTFNEGPHVPIRLIIRITGSNPDGVLSAALAFARHGVLGGVLPVPPFNPAPRTILTVGSDDLAVRQPGAAPLGTLKNGNRSLTSIGFVMADALDLDGFRQQTGVAPLWMWRVKYAPETGIDSFATSPHRRNTLYELLAVELPPGTDTQAVLRALNATQEVSIGNLTFRATKPVRFGDPDTKAVAVASGTHVLVLGNTLYLESMPPTHEKMLLEALAAKVKGGAR